MASVEAVVLTFARHETTGAVKRVIRGIRMDEARRLADEALRQETSRAVVALLHEALAKALPEPRAVG